MSSTICVFCGGHGEWFTNGDGQAILSCACKRPRRSVWDIGIDQLWSDVCWETKCPECGENVWFIRHNSGSIWVDELGWPWEKHACFADRWAPIPPQAGIPRPAHGHIVRACQIGQQSHILVAWERGRITGHRVLHHYEIKAGTRVETRSIDGKNELRVGPNRRQCFLENCHSLDYKPMWDDVERWVKHKR